MTTATAHRLFRFPDQPQTGDAALAQQPQTHAVEDHPFLVHGGIEWKPGRHQLWVGNETVVVDGEELTQVPVAGFVNGHAPNGHRLVLAAAGQPNPKIIVAVKTPLLEGKHAGEGFEQRQLQLNMGDVCGTRR